MGWKDRIRKYEWVIVPIVLIVAAWLSGDYYGQKKVRESLVAERDTVTRVVTVYKDFPNPQKTAQIGHIPIPTYKFIADTINAVEWREIHDTTVVYLPREQMYYEEDEGRLRIWISGYDPRLDRYELDKAETVITNTVTASPPKWAFSLDGGFGTDIFAKAVMLYPFLGARVNYESRFELGAEAGYGANFGNNTITTDPVIKVKFKYAFLRL